MTGSAFRLVLSVLVVCSALSTTGCKVRVLDIDPECGVPGESATVWGTGFARYEDRAMLSVGGIPIEPTEWNNFQIVFVVPDLEDGPTTLVGTTSDGKERSYGWAICTAGGGTGGTGGGGGAGGGGGEGGTGGGPIDLCVGIDCDDENECTADTCDPLTGCDNAAVTDGTSCEGDTGTCQAGSCEANCVATGPEICDGLDNDCNELVDDGVADLVSGSDEGECQAEIQRCTDGAFAIVQVAVGPSEELCDALDNDCNGSADDGLADRLSGTDVGLCQFTIERCTDGAFAVVQIGVDPMPELCDLLDNNCNGVPDDAIGDIVTGTDVGECQTGIDQCIGGTFVNVQTEIGPGLEQCDGLDNDCSGTPDDGIADIVTGIDTGECEPEIESCINGSFVITQFAVGPSPETCDGLDNDCNASSDEGIADIITGTNVGECQESIESCIGGTFTVVQAGVGPATEQCDGLDNSCSGQSDDGIADIVTGTDLGECRTEIERCQGGAFVIAQSGIGPSTETCDGLDNDCNGITDDEPVCSPVNQPPVLQDPGAMAVTVGSSLKFTLSATDGDLDRITYGVAPLPLPPNAGFNMEKAEFTFAPTFDEVGSYDLTFSASDGQDADEITVAIDVLAPPAGQITELRGRVLDTTDALQGIDTPVVGATISLINTPYETTTDSQGYFVLSGVPGGDQVFDINPFTASPAPDGGPYAGFREALHIIDGAVNDHTRPFYIPRIAQESLTTVDPNNTTIVENATLGMTMIVAPHTAKGPNGADFTGQLSISLVPENLAPAQMPEGLVPAILVTVQPVGVTFSTPAPITFPNLDELEPGQRAKLWSLDPDAGRFVVVGTLEASADGQSLVTIEGGIRAADWHYAENELPTADDDDDDDDDDDQCTVGSDVGMSRGNLTVDHTTVAFRSLSRSRARRLVYDSLAADPQPIVQSQVTPRPLARLPEAFSISLKVAGTTSPKVFYSTALFKSSLNPVRVPAQFDASALPSGLYPYIFVSDFGFLRSSSRLQIGSTTFARVGSVRGSGSLRVNNQIDSPFGAGWTLAETQRLHVAATEDVAITEGDGNLRTYLLANRSDIALCGGVECERADSGTGASIGPVIRAGYTSRLRTILPNGEMWHAERTPFGAGFILHRYLPDGTELPPIRHGLAETPNIVATHTGNVYMAGPGDNGFPLDAIYRFSDDRSSLEAVAPGREPACGWYSIIYPIPPDPLDPSKEEVLAFGDDLRGAGGYGLFRIDLNDTDGDGVYCTGAVANLTALGIEYIRNVRQAPDGAVFVDNNGCCFPNSGIHRIENGQATMLRDREAHPNNTTKDIAIGPEDGLLYALVGGDVGGPAIRILRLDPVTGVELGFLTPPPKPDQKDNWVTLDFFPRDVSQGDSDGKTQYWGLPGDYSTLVRNDVDGTYTRTLKGGTRIEFDADGNHVATVDRNGNTTTYSYDGSGKLTSIVDPPLASLETTLLYDADGRVSSIIDPFNRTTELLHDAEGNLTRIIDPDVSEREFEYDGRHRMVRQRSKRGFDTLYEYNFAGRLVRSEGPDGSVKQVVPRDTVALADVSSGIGVGGNPAPLVPNEQQLASITDGDGVQTRMVMNRRGQATGVSIGPESTPSSLQSFEHDDNQNTTAWARSGEAGATYSYDFRGNIKSMTDRQTGEVSTYTREPKFGFLETATGPSGQIVIGRDAFGNPTSFTSAEGRTGTTAYDGFGLPDTGVSNFGVTTTYGYDGQGNLVSLTQDDGTTIRTTTITRTTEGYIDTMTDPIGQVTDYDYDTMGRRVTETLPGPMSTQYAFGPGGTLSSVTPPGRPPHAFNYTPANLLQRYAPPDAGDPAKDTSYSYTPGRRLAAIQNPDGDDMSLGYDGAGRLAQVTVPRGDFQFDYGAVDPLAEIGMGTGSLLTGVTTPEGQSINYQYANGLLQSMEWVGPVSGLYGFTHDGSKRVVTETINSGADITFIHDLDGYVIQASELLVNRNPATGGVDSTSLRNVTQAFGFNGFGEITNQEVVHGGQTLYQLQLMRDGGGRITESTETVEGVATTRVYTYDTAGHLEEVTENGTVERTYAYDANGNRTSLTTPSSTTTYAYDAQDRILNAGAITYERTWDGNRSERVDTGSGDTTSYAYGTDDALLSVQLPDGTVIDYLTDLSDPEGIRGRRVGKVVDGVKTQGFLYRDHAHVGVELDGSDNVVSVFIYGTDLDVPDYMVRGSSVYQFVTDHVGSVRLVVDADTGQIAQRIDYDEFGNVLNDTNPGFQPFGFVGGIYDPDTGLVRLGARDYDPEIGRFALKDPARFGGLDSNLYSYAGQDPINFVDLDGYKKNKKNKACPPDEPKPPPVPPAPTPSCKEKKKKPDPKRCTREKGWWTCEQDDKKPHEDGCTPVAVDCKCFIAGESFDGTSQRLCCVVVVHREKANGRFCESGGFHECYDRRAGEVIEDLDVLGQEMCGFLSD